MWRSECVSAHCVLASMCNVDLFLSLPFRDSVKTSAAPPLFRTSKGRESHQFQSLTAVCRSFTYILSLILSQNNKFISGRWFDARKIVKLLWKKNVPLNSYFFKINTTLIISHKLKFLQFLLDTLNVSYYFCRK